MDDSDYLRLLTIQAEQANAFLSNARKWERERWVCQRLLQGLNIPYRSEDFTPAGQEPPDVLFRDAAFEVFFVLDEGRRLNDEWREELQRRRSAFSLAQLVRRQTRPRRIAATGLLAPCRTSRRGSGSTAICGSSRVTPAARSTKWRRWSQTAASLPLKSPNSSASDGLSSLIGTDTQVVFK